jgi:hypothetical protein
VRGEERGGQRETRRREDEKTEEEAGLSEVLDSGVLGGTAGRLKEELLLLLRPW